MAHLSEDCIPLRKEEIIITNLLQLNNHRLQEPDVFLFRFPANRTNSDARKAQHAFEYIHGIAKNLPSESVVCILTAPADAAHLLPVLERDKKLHFKLWIAVKTTQTQKPGVNNRLPERHAALLVLTRYNNALKHTKTRVAYSYCPTCHKTTKDYGGKKHLYHEYGTLISDVWRDIECEPALDISPITNRLQDLFGLPPYKTLKIFDLRQCSELIPDVEGYQTETSTLSSSENTVDLDSDIINDDCLNALKKIPDNSIDFCFADPPYNLQKKYNHWDDEMESVEYFNWCDIWLSELARVLKPGSTLAVVNIPQWAVRHYRHLDKILTFQNWIAWDAISAPVRLIMPSHYSILCFTKGEPEPLPSHSASNIEKQEQDILKPLEQHFCLRAGCVKTRKITKTNDRDELNDIWSDIHRIKHNSKRVDHPCQLPPNLMRRLYAVFTRPGEIILDCFNGAGTSSLVAEEMGRRYIGIELSPEYHQITLQRHTQLRAGVDPFGKNDDIPKAKNSRVERLPKQKYAVPKKVLQLDVRRIAQELGRLPTRDEVARMSIYPMKYYDEYFIGWGEVCAAARTTGMSELPTDKNPGNSENFLQLTFNV